MKSLKSWLVYFFFTMVPVALVAQTQASIIMCKNKKIVRTLRILNMEKEGKCITLYTKAGTDKIVGSGRSLSTCTTVAANIKTNLEKAAWKCKEATAEVTQYYDMQ